MDQQYEELFHAVTSDLGVVERLTRVLHDPREELAEDAADVLRKSRRHFLERLQQNLSAIRKLEREGSL